MDKLNFKNGELVGRSEFTTRLIRARLLVGVRTHPSYRSKIGLQVQGRACCPRREPKSVRAVSAVSHPLDARPSRATAVRSQTENQHDTTRKSRRTLARTARAAPTRHCARTSFRRNRQRATTKRCTPRIKAKETLTAIRYARPTRGWRGHLFVSGFARWAARPAARRAWDYSISLRIQ